MESGQAVKFDLFAAGVFCVSPISFRGGAYYAGQPRLKGKGTQGRLPPRPDGSASQQAAGRSLAQHFSHFAKTQNADFAKMRFSTWGEIDDRIGQGDEGGIVS